jgi:hypothetical protein
MTTDQQTTTDNARHTTKYEAGEEAGAKGEAIASNQRFEISQHDKGMHP